MITKKKKRFDIRNLYLHKPRRLNEDDKLYYSVIAIFSIFIVVIFFNVIIAPLLFLVYVLYIINNNNNRITLPEKTMFFIVVLPFLVYVLSGRLFGMFTGLLLGFIVVLKGSIYMYYLWRHR